MADEISYRVTVSALLSDEGAGELHAMLWTSNVEVDTIVQSARTFQTNMVSLGTNGAGTDAVVNADITHSFADQTAFESNSTEPLEPGKDYYLYMYAKDEHDNDTVIRHSDAIKLNSESTVVEANSSLLVAGSVVGQYWQLRGDGTIIQQPDISSTPDGDHYFGFFERATKTGFANVLYANIEVDPGEFAIGNVYSFALESPIDISGNLGAFTALLFTIKDEPAKQYASLYNGSETFSHEVNKFYASVGSLPSPMAYGKTYTLYHACHVKGLNKLIVKQSDQVVTGTPPTILNSSANITVTAS
jgi:hypothetical protein